ncbi:MAG: hypothetical protein H6990_01320 [Pseudomonadales bacterium]|nr:hypothetical protein [Pseudomonadales bacterium]
MSPAGVQHRQGSHHDLAVQPPTPETVLGDFDDASFTYNGVTTRFYRDGDLYKVRTDGEDGKLTDYTVKHVFESTRCSSTCCPCPAAACRHRVSRLGCAACRPGRAALVSPVPG